jgi:GNAT superfamily N-acetyltransferase
MSPERGYGRGVGAGRSEVVIRAGTPADAEAVGRLHVRTWQAAYPHVFPPERLAELSVERLTAQWRESPPFVAEAEGTVVGFVSVGASRDSDANGELFAIYVDPDHWGTGVGRALIAAGEQRLRELGLTDVILWVLEDNPRARRFYEQAGWHADGTSRPITFRGIEVPEVRYRKRLGTFTAS